MAQQNTDQTKHEVTIDGGFKRKPTEYHNVITAEESKFTAEKDRYHLYYSAACPWCHRVDTMIALKGLRGVISRSNVNPVLHGLSHLGSDGYIGWEFSDKYPDPLHQDSKSVWDVYKIDNPEYPNKKLTVPILFDKKTKKIVNNESAEIIKFLNTAFNKFAENAELDLDPDDEKIQSQMSEWNDIIYPGLNDGVYRCGFAESQEAYDDSFDKVFATLDKLEEHFKTNRYLCGDTMTLSDIRAWVTLIRFDAIYFTHFKCNLKMIHKDYPNVWGYTREIYQMNDGLVGKTFDLEYTKTHYFASHKNINPFSIVPKGPMIDYDEPHGRDKQNYAK